MQLPGDILYTRLEAMPSSDDHKTVWHLCYAGLHLAHGRELLVTELPPEIPEADQEGMFLIRFHPLVDRIVRMDDGTLTVDGPDAESFPYSTVWSVPLKPEAF